MKKFGWKKKSKFPAKQRKKYNLPKRRMKIFAETFKGIFSNLDIVRFYQKQFGKESPSTPKILEWCSEESTHFRVVADKGDGYKSYRCKVPGCNSYFIITPLPLPDIFSMGDCQKHQRKAFKY